MFEVSLICGVWVREVDSSVVRILRSGRNLDTNCIYSCLRQVLAVTDSRTKLRKEYVNKHCKLPDRPLVHRETRECTRIRHRVFAIRLHNGSMTRFGSRGCIGAFRSSVILRLRSDVIVVINSYVRVRSVHACDRTVNHQFGLFTTLGKKEDTPPPARSFRL